MLYILLKMSDSLYLSTPNHWIYKHAEIIVY